MGNLNPYELMMGILDNLPGSKETIWYSEKDVLNFLRENREQYEIINGYTKQEIEHWLDVLDYSLKKIPHLKDKRAFKRKDIREAFNFISTKYKCVTESELSQIKDLSAKFADIFLA